MGYMTFSYWFLDLAGPRKMAEIGSFLLSMFFLPGSFLVGSDMEGTLEMRPGPIAVGCAGCKSCRSGRFRTAVSQVRPFRACKVSSNVVLSGPADHHTRRGVVHSDLATRHKSDNASRSVFAGCGFWKLIGEPFSRVVTCEGNEGLRSSIFMPRGVHARLLPVTLLLLVRFLRVAFILHIIVYNDGGSLNFTRSRTLCV